LDRPAEIAGRAAQRFLNDLLLSNQLYVGALGMGAPCLLEILSRKAQHRQRIARAFSFSLTLGELGVFSACTAWMIQVPFDVNHPGSTQVAQSMRGSGTDSNVTYILPTGQGTVLTTGPLRVVASVGDGVRAADAAERVRRELLAARTDTKDGARMGVGCGVSGDLSRRCRTVLAPGDKCSVGYRAAYPARPVGHRAVLAPGTALRAGRSSLFPGKFFVNRASTAPTSHPRGAAQPPLQPDSPPCFDSASFRASPPCP
jgi:hypothetical protein